MPTPLRRRMAPATLTILLCLAGCASGGSTTRSNPTRILRTELQDLNHLDAHQAVERLRPRWLTARGTGMTAPAVYVDGSRRVGGIDDLRAIPVSQIEQIEYLSGPDATTRFGTGYDGGAIMVSLRRGP